jgi:hypothetical protein
MHDSAASNLLSFSDTLKHVFTFSEDNTCMPHTDNHVGEAFNTPLLDEFMALYNTVISKTNSASLRIFAEVTGKMPGHVGKTRWWSTNDVQELSLLPNTNDGKLLQSSSGSQKEQVLSNSVSNGSSAVGTMDILLDR